MTMKASRKLSRKRFPVWLRELVDSGEAQGLEWLDSEKKTFKIPWTRVDSPDFDVTRDAVVFQRWAEFTGRFRRGERADPSVWKTRFRCAIRKMTDIQEVKVHNSLEEKGGNRPYRVFKFKGDTPTNDKHKRSQSPSSTSEVTSFGMAFQKKLVRDMMMSRNPQQMQNLDHAANTFNDCQSHTYQSNTIFGHADWMEEPCTDKSLPVGVVAGEYCAYPTNFSQYAFRDGDNVSTDYGSQLSNSTTAMQYGYLLGAPQDVAGTYGACAEREGTMTEQTEPVPSLPRISVYDVERILRDEENLGFDPEIELQGDEFASSSIREHLCASYSRSSGEDGTRTYTELL